jgi:cell fate regulator YaaT (PSP1 superfamily)
MLSHDHLVGYGVSGDFGRFRAAAPVEARRGRRVVVRTPRGLELGSTLRPADERLARWLPNTTVGELLRAATSEDERLAQAHARRAGEVMARAGRLIDELSLPAALLDVEILLDGQNAVLHLVRWQECDVRELVRPLSGEFDLVITLADLAAPVADHADDHGCGSCGSGGGCGDCSSGGGCGSCGSEPAESDKAHFAELRQQMERRVTLL